MAHSYGTNMSIHALTRTAHDVDSFISFGSSGYPDGLVEDDDLGNLHVKDAGGGHPAVYATDGFWDWTSNIGRGWWSQNSFNPADPGSGAYIFDSDGTGQYLDASPIDGEGVTSHSRHDGDGTGYLDLDAQAFITVMEVLNGQHDRIDWIAEPADEDGWDLEHHHPWRKLERSSTWRNLEERLPWSEERE
ncbi:hypothetical protein [Nesterenkonia sp. K-15-9-6]|uniref:hypothetical protein n=1 Tax=Nesterenkonia sp. K-15-9-6 TaxID=3093918 RepID=UPI004044CB61